MFYIILYDLNKLNFFHFQKFCIDFIGITDNKYKTGKRELLERETLLSG